MDTEDLIIFPIQLRPDVIAKVHIPRDLTKEEAEKIARVLMALSQPTGE